MAIEVDIDGAETENVIRNKFNAIIIFFSFIPECFVVLILMN
jgi:hypothetical protein